MADVLLDSTNTSIDPGTFDRSFWWSSAKVNGNDVFIIPKSYLEKGFMLGNNQAWNPNLIKPEVLEYLRAVDVSDDIAKAAVKNLDKADFGGARGTTSKNWKEPSYSDGAYVIDASKGYELGLDKPGVYFDVSQRGYAPIAGLADINGKLTYVGNEGASGMRQVFTTYGTDGVNTNYVPARGGFFGGLADFIDELGPLNLAWNLVLPGAGTAIYAGNQAGHGNWGNALLTIALANTPGADGKVATSGFEGTFLEMPSIGEATKAIQTTLGVSPAAASAIMSGTLKTIASGGSVEQAFKNIASTYLGNLAGETVSDMMKVTGFKDLQTITGNVAKATTTAWLRNEDVNAAAKMGFIESAIPAAFKAVPGWDKLSASQQKTATSIAIDAAKGRLNDVDPKTLIKNAAVNFAVDTALNAFDAYKDLPVTYKDLIRKSLVAVATDQPLNVALGSFLSDQVQKQVTDYNKAAYNGFPDKKTYDAYSGNLALYRQDIDEASQFESRQKAWQDYVAAVKANDADARQQTWENYINLQTGAPYDGQAQPYPPVTSPATTPINTANSSEAPTQIFPSQPPVEPTPVEPTPVEPAQPPVTPTGETPVTQPETPVTPPVSPPVESTDEPLPPSVTPVEPKPVEPLTADKIAQSEGWPSLQLKEAYNGNLASYIGQRDYQAAIQAGFPDYATLQKYGGDAEAYRRDQAALAEQRNAAETLAVQQGWPSLQVKNAYEGNLDKYNSQQDYQARVAGFPDRQTKQEFGGDINKYKDFVNAKSEEDKVVEFLKNQGIPPTPERIMSIMKDWDYDPKNPSAGLSEAVDKSVLTTGTGTSEVSVADYYAKQEGWKDYAEKLQAQVNGIESPASWSDYLAGKSRPRVDIKIGDTVYIDPGNGAEGATGTGTGTGAGSGTGTGTSPQEESKPSIGGLIGIGTSDPNAPTAPLIGPGSTPHPSEIQSNYGVIGTGTYQPPPPPVVEVELNPTEEPAKPPVTPPVTSPVTPPVVPAEPVKPAEPEPSQPPVTPPVTPPAEPVTPPVTPPAETGTTPVTPPVIPPVAPPSGDTIALLKSEISDQIKANEAAGLTRDQATQKAVEDVAKSVGQTKEDVLDLLGQTKEDLVKQYSENQVKTQEQIAEIKSDLSAAINSAKAQGKAGDAALRDAIDRVATNLRLTGDSLLDQIGRNYEDLKSDFGAQIGGVQSQIDDVKTALQFAISDAKASGLQGDKALQAAIDAVAMNQGTTREDLLKQLGTTEVALRQDFTNQIGGVQAQIGDVRSSLEQAINDAKASGLQGDQALQSAINTVASSLGTTKDDLLAKIGTTETGLRQELASQLGGVRTDIDALQAQLTDQGKALLAQLTQQGMDYGTALQQVVSAQKQQVTDIQKSLTDQIAANEVAGLSRDQATAKAIEAVAANLGTTKDALLTRLGTSEGQLRAEMQAGQALTSEQIVKLESQLTDQGKSLVLQLQQQGQSYQKALSDVVAAQNAQTSENQQQTTQQIQATRDSLTAQITANEAAGMTRDQAINQAVQDVASSVGTTREVLLAQMGQTEASLKQQFSAGQAQTQAQISQLDAATQAKFSQMSEAQKAQTLQLAQATNDLQGSINTVAQQTAQQIAAGQQQTAQQIQATKDSLSAQIAANEAAGLTRDQATTKAIGDLSTQMGVDKQSLLTQLGTTEQALRQELTAGLSGLAGSMQAQYNALNATQKAQFDAMVQQGADINSAMAQVRTGLEQQITGVQQQTAEQIAGVKNSLAAQISANEAAGLSRDEATTKAINDLSSQMGVDKQSLISQLGTTEQALRTELQSGLAGVTQTFQDQYNALSATQKAQFDAMVEQGASTQAALSQVQSGLQQQIGELGQTQTQQYNQLSQSQKDLYSQLVAQGASQSDALNAAVANLSQTQAQQYSQLSQGQKDLFNQMLAQGASQTEALNSAISGVQGQISGVQQSLEQQLAQQGALVQQKFAGLTAAQQAEVQARIQQGQSLQDAIASSQAATSQQISGVQQGLQSQLAQQSAQTQQAFANMTAAQQAEVAARMQQGQDLQAAISASQQATQQQITGGLTALSQDFQNKLAASDATTQTAFASMNAAQQAEAAARVQQGQDLQAAISASSTAAAQQIAQSQSALEGQLSAQGKQFFDVLRQQGVDYTTALNQAVQAQAQQSSTQISGVQTALEGQLSAQGKQFFDALRQQGLDYNTALQQATEAQNQQFQTGQQRTEAAISALDRGTQEKFNALTDAQKGQALQLAQSTSDLKGSIDTVASTVTGYQAQTQAEFERLRQEQAVRDQAAADAAAAQAAAQAQAQEEARAAQVAKDKAAADAAAAQNAALTTQIGALQTAQTTAQDQQTRQDLAKQAQQLLGTTTSASTGSGKTPEIKPGGLTAAMTRDMPYQSIYNPGEVNLIKSASDKAGNESMNANNLNPQGQQDASQSGYYNYGAASPGYDVNPATFAGGLAQVAGFARGGLAMVSPLMAAAGGVSHKGSHYVQGAGGGQDDLIDARLADGEYVFDADIVAALGDGSNKEGAKKLDAMREAIRKHKRAAPTSKIPPMAKSPLAYFKEANNG